MKLIKRKRGNVEKQYRINVGDVPIAYKTEPDGRYIYILDGALTTFATAEEAARSSTGAPPVPPCITYSSSADRTRVIIRLEDRGSRLAILKISADAIRVQLKQSVQNTTQIVEELLDYMRKLLDVKLADMTIERGDTPRDKILLIRGIQADVVFQKLMASMKKA